MIELTINGRSTTVEVDPAVPLLSVLRQDLGLVGAKRGCAMEQCYACCVLVDGRAQPSCQLPVGHVGDLPVTTVEGLEPLHEFFEVEQAGQCGFCIAGMVVAAQGLLNQIRQPNDAQIREALDTNLCRCGVYDRVRRAIRFRIGQPEDSIWEVQVQEPLVSDGETSPGAFSPSLANAANVESWILIDSAETITIYTGKAELGQGVYTSLARIAADELGVDFERIRVVGPDTDITPNEGVTSGSLSIEHSGGAVRLAAAAARASLTAMGAEHLETNTAELKLNDGVLHDHKTGRSVSYWELQGGRRFRVPLDPARPPITQPANGFSTGARNEDGWVTSPRIDLPAKISGGVSYVHDLVLPGMLHSRIVRPPGLGSKLLSLDAAEVEALPGVVAVVRDGSFVAVVAEREEQATTAAERLSEIIEWSPVPDQPDPSTELRTGKSVDYFCIDGTPVDHSVEPLVSETGPSFDVTATYTKPFTLHGSLGPSAAVAQFDNGRLTVWTHSQGVFVLRESLAEALNLPEDQIRVIHAQGAGCYGHNGADDVALDAALVALALSGQAISVVWSRADEHRWEPFGPAMIVELSANVDSGGRIEAFDSENWSYSHSTRPERMGDGSSRLLAAWHREEALERPLPTPFTFRHVGAHRNSDPLYRMGDRRIQTHMVQTNSYRTSALRGLGAFANVFAIESFMDEMAAHVGIDPVAFRLANLDDPRARAVITSVAEAVSWHDWETNGETTGQELALGRGLGFAQYKNAQTYFAVVIDLSVERSTGLIAIEQATIAADAGRIVSPDGLSNQLEGGCVQAASWALKEEVRLGGSLSAQSPSVDWETYPVLRFSESFPIRTILLDRPDQASLGCGEAAQGPTAAAIANAVKNATGARLRALPLTQDRVLPAIG